MKTLDHLTAARERLSNPAMWNKGGGGWGDPNAPSCVAVTISNVTGNVFHAETEAFAALLRVLGIDPNDFGCSTALYRWNDDPETTHAEVMAAFDRAIANERAKAQEFDVAPLPAMRETVNA